MSESADNIASISELLKLSNSQYRIYDLGRRVTKISKEQFEKVEQAMLPYPFPSQGHAFFAVAFWQKQTTTPYLWFIKLPLDERGLLNQGARNHFIAIIIEALGQDLTVDPSEKQAALLEKNPYHFTPAQYKLAAINSIVSLALSHSPSQYYTDVINYMTGAKGWQAWQDIGVQGLSDFATRLTHDQHQNLLIDAIAHLPEPVLIPLASALENIELPVQIINELISRLQLALHEKNQPLISAILRALASSSTHPYTLTLIKALLDDENSISEDIMIIIAGRLWSALANDNLLVNYFERLAAMGDDELFLAMFKDLVAVPEIRPLLLQAIRNPNRSVLLSRSLNKLFDQ